MKRVVSWIMAAIFVASMVQVNVHAEEIVTNEYADKLSEVGMFNGSDKGFELDREPTRLEGLVMMMRMLGIEEEAQDFKEKVVDFEDVPAWGERYVQYAYKLNITKGVSKEKFGSSSEMDKKSYLTLMLRSLGYDDDKNDFTWSNAAEKAVEVGIIKNSDINSKKFTRGDVAEVSYNTLKVNLKGQDKLLVEKLVEDNKIDITKIDKLDIKIKGQEALLEEALLEELKQIEDEEINLYKESVLAKVKPEQPAGGNMGGGSKMPGSGGGGGGSSMPGGGKPDKEPVVEEPVVEEPVVEEPVVEEPVVEEPVVEEPVVEEPVVEEPVVEEPVVEEPVVEEPVVEEPDDTTAEEAAAQAAAEAAAAEEAAAQAAAEAAAAQAAAEEAAAAEAAAAQAAAEEAAAQAAAETAAQAAAEAEAAAQAAAAEAAAQAAAEEAAAQAAAEEAAAQAAAEAAAADGPLASAYGLVPNSTSSANNNATLLNKMINQYGSIVIDGDYYIGTTSQSITNKNIEIVGTDGSELIFDNSSNTTLFDPNKVTNLTLKNIGFKNLNNSSILFIASSSTRNKTKINQVIVEDSFFEGNISLYRLSGDQSVNPNSVDFGVDEFVFKNNRVTNTLSSFIVLTDIPLRYAEVSNNYVNNFKYIFFNAAITNGIKYSNQIFEAKDYIYVYNNTVENDDNWWAAEGGGMYLTFVLTENVRVKYDSNHVEGLKANFNMSVYDAYLSSRYVTYTNNTWKNNITFHPDKIYNSLMKSKGGKVNNIPVERLYANNTFIVEESFAQKVGQSKDDLFVYFYDLTTTANNYTIENNLFDVYDLRFVKSSDEIKNFTFNNNIIKAKYALGSLTKVRLTDTIQPTVEIKDNDIQIDQSGKHPLEEGTGLILVNMVDSRSNTTTGKKGKSILLSGNTIEAPITYAFYNILTDVATVTGNNIRVRSSVYKRFVSNSGYSHLTDALVTKF
ncbi:conserved exported protein of unknown function [Petrocella atlantisensis]|uniref:SLH domain-containing protein n=1 Tax=Petrocella atlantisensis TaxID=2173034 RepID=A0A3P7PB65_9FIRM|nr:hypothetical protein [Petrocella atlantisensis]VDN46158.1 conserved exported protein of unknown function [Petrocella atlantisensis]